MHRYRRYIIRVLNGYKCKYCWNELQRLPIYTSGTARKIRGYLRPITADYRMTLPGCAEALARWRSENPDLTASKIDMTEEEMERWIDRQIIAREDRILFLVTDIDGNMIGHLGFGSFDFALKCCEVDAVVRGEKQVKPGIMGDALKTLILWGKQVLQLRSILLKVFSDNTHAIRFYRRYGFREVGTIPLRKTVYNEEECWEILAHADNTAVRHYTVMRLEEDSREA